jgi:hypothetical protein
MAQKIFVPSEHNPAAENALPIRSIQISSEITNPKNTDMSDLITQMPRLSSTMTPCFKCCGEPGDGASLGHNIEQS